MNVARNKGRDVHGIVLFNKPVGVTSNTALQRVKRLFNARKAGHTGSLDPLASGLLPICLGEATKMSAYLLDADKGYQATFKLGVRTNTGDADGEVISVAPVGRLGADAVRDVLAQFTGEIRQIPPMHSAIKQNGVPLYKLAHRGLEVERQARTVVIHELALLGMTTDELHVRVRCSKGTYIRTLAEDIGEALRCGAHVSTLERTLAGPFTLDRARTLEQLQMLAGRGVTELDATLLPVESALADWPSVKLTEDAVFYVRRGQPVFVPKVTSRGLVRLFTGQMNFIGVGQVLDDGRIAPRRLVKS
jgi:tRNA pseudouridine55 synthase